MRTARAAADGRNLQPSIQDDALRLTRLRSLHAGLRALVALGLSACGGDVGPTSEPGPPAAVTIRSGSGQDGTVGTGLPLPLTARVTDADGRGVGGVQVTFAAAAGSGSVTPAIVLTDDEGDARATWTLGTVAGPASASASVPGLEPAVASATALPGPPAALGFASAPTAAVAGVAFDPPVSVAILDPYGNRVTGASAEVHLALDAGDLVGPAVVTAVDGLASFPGLRIDAAGPSYVLTATAEGLDPAASEAFPVSNGVVDGATSKIVVAPATVAIGDDATVTVTARDAFGNPVPGVTVQLAATGSGNTIVQPPVTGPDGTAGGTIRSDTPGTRTVSAVVGGVALEEQATLVVEGPPEVAQVVVTPGDVGLLVDQTATFTAAALDAQGNPVLGATLTWSSSDPDVATVSDGVVTALRAGAVTITATSDGHDGTASVTVSFKGGTYTNITYCTMNGVDVRMDLYVPDASAPRPLPVVVHVHGGGWRSGSKSSGTRFADLMPLLVGRGYLVASLDYRLAPTYKYPAQIQDVKCAVRHLRARAARYGLDPDRIGAWGGSAGGQLVALLGTADASVGFDDVGGFQGQSSEVQAVAATSAITDFTHPEELNDNYNAAFKTWPDPTSPEMIQASPVTHVSPGDAPFYLAIGEDDDLVLPAQSERLHQLLLDAGVPSTLLRVVNGDHDLLPTDGPTDPSAAGINQRLADFFDQHLR